MALFSRDKKEQNEEASAAKKAKAPEVAAERDLSSVILSPRITEKGVGLNDKNVYTFIVRKDATKYTVADAVRALFKVTPMKVNIVNKSPRQFMSRSKGRAQKVKGMKKAYVYLKEGDRIDLV